MSRIKNLTELEKLAFYDVTLVNAKTKEKFSIPLEEVGFSSESIEEGNKLYEIARKALNESLSAQKQRFEMHKVFHKIVAELDEKFRVDWKKSKIIFKRDIVAQDKLGLKNPYYRTYVKWIELARQFYTELSNNPGLTERLSNRNYSNEETQARLTVISELARSGSQNLSIEVTDKGGQGTVVMRLPPGSHSFPLFHQKPVYLLPKHFCIDWLCNKSISSCFHVFFLISFHSHSSYCNNRDTFCFTIFS